MRVEPAPIQPPRTSIIPPLMMGPVPTPTPDGLIGRIVPPQPRHSTTELSPIHGSWFSRRAPGVRYGPSIIGDGAVRHTPFQPNPAFSHFPTTPAKADMASLSA